jgi:hypothetical protein
VDDVNLTRIRVSVIQTWALTDDSNQAAYAASRTGYKTLINSIKNGDSYNYTLPWTRKNHYWQYQVGEDYQNRKSFDLVAGLIPLRRTGTIPMPEDQFDGATAQWEVLWQPYSVSTIVHATLKDIPDGSSTALLTAALDEALRTGIGDDHKLQDGLPQGLWDTQPSHPDIDPGTARYRPDQPIALLSGIAAPGQTTDGKGMANVLAGRFEGPTDDGITLKTTGSGLAVSGDTVAVVLTKTLERTPDRLVCLQNNLATSVALQQAMLRLQTTPSADAIADWYKSRAAMILTHAYNGTDLPHADSVYKTPLTRLWLQRSPEVVGPINQSAALCEDPPPDPIVLPTTAAAPLDGGKA